MKKILLFFAMIIRLILELLGFGEKEPDNDYEENKEAYDEMGRGND